MRPTDPERMSREATMAELGELLAAGFKRHIASSIGPSAEGSDPQKPLDASPEVEAPCVSPMEVSE